MPWGSWINDLPTEFFLVVHVTAFALGAGFAWLAFKRQLALLGSAFSLFAAAELVYMTYHVDWTVFLFLPRRPSLGDVFAYIRDRRIDVVSACGEHRDDRAVRAVLDRRDLV